MESGRVILGNNIWIKIWRKSWRWGEVGKKFPGRESSLRRIPIAGEHRGLFWTGSRPVWPQAGWREWGKWGLQDLGHNEDVRLYPKAVRSSWKSGRPGDAKVATCFFVFCFSLKCTLIAIREWIRMGSDWVWGLQSGGYCNAKMRDNEKDNAALARW